MTAVAQAKADLADAVRALRAIPVDRGADRWDAEQEVRRAVVAASQAADAALRALTREYERTGHGLHPQVTRPLAEIEADAAPALDLVRVTTAAGAAHGVPDYDCTGGRGALDWRDRADRRAREHYRAPRSGCGPTARERREAEDFAHDTWPGYAPHWAQD